jgi:ribosome biogenesis protein ENP2
MLRAHMHGFFVDNRLWAKARALADPLAFDTYRAAQVGEQACGAGRGRSRYSWASPANGAGGL